MTVLELLKLASQYFYFGAKFFPVAGHDAQLTGQRDQLARVGFIYS